MVELFTQSLTIICRDLRLRIAADICQDIRSAIYEKLKFTCSAGIAHNKTLAKLVSALHKPNKQTVLRDCEVLDFMKTLPFTKIRGLGGIYSQSCSKISFSAQKHNNIGKFGDEVEDHLHAETAGDIWQHSLATLQKTLGEASGLWIYEISRGICTEGGKCHLSNVHPKLV